jgi:ArsR family transcriptional regulator, arsenate/arsenite/antimonite-responsive transcriptional repressor
VEKITDAQRQDFVLLAHYSKSIGHPTRLSILKELADRGGWANGEIIAVSGVSPSTIIQHLRELKRAGIIQGRIFGAQCSYGLNTEILLEFQRIWGNTIPEIVKSIKIA